MTLPWRAAVYLACAAALNYADRTSLSSVFPLLQSELGMSDVQLAYVGSFFLWSYAFASPASGLVADRWPRHRVVVFSLAAWSLVTLLAALARNAQELLASRVLLGLAEAAYLPAAVGLLADHHASKTIGRALAIHLCGLNVGLVGGGALAGYLGETQGWRASLIVLGALGLLLAAVLFFVLPAAPALPAASRQRRPLWPQIRLLLANSSYLFLAAQAMLVSVGTWMFFNWMPLFFRESFGLSLALAGFSGTAVLQFSAAAGAVLGGVLSDRAAAQSPRGRLRLMLLCYLICAPCLLVFLSPAGLAVVSLAVVLFSSLRSVATANETPSLCDLIPAEDRGTAQSLMNMLNTLAGGAGVFVAGYLKADWGLGGVFAGVALFMLLAAFCTTRVATPPALAS